MRRKAQWVDSSSDPDRYRLSHAEVMQRKVALVSKNREVARQEWQARQQMIKEGRLPEDLRKVIAPPKKKYSAKSTAILTEKKPQVKPEPRQPDLPKSPKSVMLRTTSTRAPVVREDDPLDEISKLELAMKELEFAMTEAIDQPGRESEGLSDDSVFSISEEEDQPPHTWRETTPAWHDSVLKPRQAEVQGGNGQVKPSWSVEEPAAPSWHNSALKSRAEEGSSKPCYPSDINPPAKPSWSLDYEEPSQHRSIQVPRQNEIGSSTPGYPANIDYQAKPSWSLDYEEPKPRKAEIEGPANSQAKPSWSLTYGEPMDSEPHTADWENSEYLATLLEQTRKDLAFMSIAEPSLSPMSSPPSEEMPQPKAYTLKPSSREPVLRGKLAGQSLALVDHMRPKYII
jgi:hypothetical protein